MKKYLVPSILLVVIVIGVVLITHEQNDKSHLTIGVITPLSRENAVIGQGIRNAVELAKEAYGQADVTVLFEDDQYDAKIGLSAFHKLRTIDHIDAIINTTPSVMDSIQPLVQAHPVVVAQLTEPEISSDDSVFQFMPSGAKLYQTFGDFIQDTYSSVVIVHEPSPTFIKASKAFAEGYQSSTNHFASYQLDNTNDHHTLITKILAEKPEALSILATPSTGITFLKQLTEFRSKTSPYLLCNPDLEATVSEYLKVFDSRVFEGCLSAFFADRMNEEFKRDYRSRYNQEPTFAADYAYDAFTMLSDTFSPNISKWVDALQSLQAKGVSGDIKFDDDGVRIPSVEYHIFKNGTFVKYE